MAVLGDEELGETRSKTAAMKEADDENGEEDEDEDGDDDNENNDGVPTPKKTHTMKAVTEEARHIVPDPEEVGETRSATAAIEQAEEESKTGEH
uniref:Prothymosin alpha n=1 Tax=Plectus sambesii TaxID=2011161 RepID=A0A914UIX1_9BILA